MFREQQSETNSQEICQAQFSGLLRDYFLENLFSGLKISDADQAKIKTTVNSVIDKVLREDFASFFKLKQKQQVVLMIESVVTLVTAAVNQDPLKKGWGRDSKSTEILIDALTRKGYIGTNAPIVLKLVGVADKFALEDKPRTVPVANVSRQRVDPVASPTIEHKPLVNNDQVIEYVDLIEMISRMSVADIEKYLEDHQPAMVNIGSNKKVGLAVKEILDIFRVSREVFLDANPGAAFRAFGLTAKYAVDTKNQARSEAVLALMELFKNKYLGLLAMSAK